MREYIDLAVLAHVDETTLYMHGGIVGGGCKDGEHGIGWLPNSNEQVTDVHEWVDKLNCWKREQFQDWVQNPQWGVVEDVVPEDSIAPAESSRSQSAEASVSQSLSGQKPLNAWRLKDGRLLRGGGQELQDYGLRAEL